jgi:hypothetical protein
MSEPTITIEINDPKRLSSALEEAIGSLLVDIKYGGDMDRSDVRELPKWAEDAAIARAFVDKLDAAIAKAEEENGQ